MKDLLRLKYPAGGGRNENLDSLKFYLICVVVLGHTLWEHHNESSVINGVLYWIYTFHMPLFVFLSGYFSKKMEKQKFKWFLIRTAETLVLFQFACLLMKCYTGVSITWKLIISPYSIYWYLLSLILWRTVLQLLPSHILLQKRIIIVMSFVAGLLAGFIPVSTEFSIQRTLAFLPFFVVGFYARQQGWVERIKTVSPSYIFLIAVFAFGLFAYMLNKGIFTMTTLYENSHYNMQSDLVVRFLVWLLAFGFGAVFIKFSKPTRIASIMGTMTLFIFVYHQFIIEVVQKVLQRFNTPGSMLIILIEAIIVIVISCVIAGIPLFRYAVNPVSIFFKRK